MTQNSSNPWTELLTSGGVVVVKPERKKKDKKTRYSSPTSWMLGIMEERMLGGLSAGAAKYDKKRRRSNAKRKEGALRDLGKNYMAGQNEALREFAKIPVDMVDMMEATGPRRWPWR